MFKKKPTAASAPKTAKTAKTDDVLAAVRKEADVTEVEGGVHIQFEDWACKIHGAITPGRLATALARRPRKRKG